MVRSAKVVVVVVVVVPLGRQQCPNGTLLATRDRSMSSVHLLLVNEFGLDAVSDEHMKNQSSLFYHNALLTVRCRDLQPLAAYPRKWNVVLVRARRKSRLDSVVILSYLHAVMDVLVL
jgi:hypothetical protein